MGGSGQRITPPHSPRPGPSSPIAVRRYWWHEVTAVPTSDAASPSEAGEARPSCGLTASINYFFTPYYRKLSGECLPTGSLRWHGCTRGWLPSASPQVPRTFACAQTCAPLRTSRCTTSCAAHQMRGAQPGLTVGERPRQLVATHQTAKSCERPEFRVCSHALSRVSALARSRHDM